MPSSSYDDHLAPYLLGTLPDGPRQQIDDRLLTDELLFESLRATENELAYDYALGLLDEGARARFEQRFLNNPEIARRVDTARSILETAGAMDRRSAGPAARWPTWMRVAAAASVLLAVGWLGLQNARLRREVTSANAQARAAADRAVAQEEALRRLETARADAQPSGGSLPAAGPAAPIVVSMVLQPGARRSDAQARRVRFAPGTTAIRFQLGLPGDVRPYRSYRAHVRTPDDVEVWSGVIADREGGLPVATVPASALPPNDYELVLSGVAPSGAIEEVASYTFSVRR
jgi:hypothetical protein